MPRVVIRSNVRGRVRFSPENMLYQGSSKITFFENKQQLQLELVKKEEEEEHTLIINMVEATTAVTHSVANEAV